MESEVESRYMERLTVVVPTMNRQRFILPQIEHWAHTGAQVHVWDGSDVPLSASFLERIPHDFKYQWRLASLVNRLKLAINDVETDFCLLSQEEDFSIKSAVELCVRDLISDTEIVASTGIEAYFSRVGDRIRLIPSMPVGMSSLRERSSSLDPIERLCDHFDPFTPIHYYSICRTVCLRKAIECIPQTDVSWPSFAEFVIELCMVLQGPSRVNNVLRNLTRSIFDDDRTVSDSKRASSLDQWLSDDRFADERSIAIEELCAQMRRHGIGDRLDVEIALSSLRKWENGIRASEVRQRDRQKLRLRSRMKGVLRGTALDLAIQFQNVVLRRLSWNRVIQGAELLRTWQGTDFDRNELMQVSRRLF